MMKRVHSDNIPPINLQQQPHHSKENDDDVLDATLSSTNHHPLVRIPLLERNVTAPPSPRRKITTTNLRPTRSSIKNQPRVPLALQAIFLESQRHGEAKVPPSSSSKVAFFARKWLPHKLPEKQKTVAPPELQFGNDQVHMISPRKKPIVMSTSKQDHHHHQAQIGSEKYKRYHY
jgi:hypothetical protein